jgi:hypothetical protein
MKQPPTPSSTKNRRTNTGASNEIATDGAKLRRRPVGVDRCSARPRSPDLSGRTKV